MAKHISFCLTLLVITLGGWAQPKTICLNMIVRNETKAIERCLHSCKDLIDYWVIVDTGSTDGTQALIQKIMEGKPGELHEKPWVNFAHNRNEALLLAKEKADYLLFIDADEYLVDVDKFDKELLSQPYYLSIVRECDFDSMRILLIDTTHNWKWIGVLHEGIFCEECSIDFAQCLDSPIKMSNTKDGFRSKDPDKYVKDAQLLEHAVEQEPENSRYVFYLAQSYTHAKEYVLALKNYEKRAKMDGVEEEGWYARYMVARLHDALGFPSDVVTQEYCKVFQERMIRAEPLGYLAHHHLLKGNAILSYTLAEQALRIPRPRDLTFVEHWFYDYGFLAIRADAALKLGLKTVALDSYRKMLHITTIPDTLRQNISQLVDVLER